MERILTLKEHMQREIPILNRMYASERPITALVNLVVPLLKEHGRLDMLKELKGRIGNIESRTCRKMTVLEKWLNSPRSFIKIIVVNKWGKKITRKVYKREIEEDISELMNWIYSSIVYELLFRKGFAFTQMRK